MSRATKDFEWLNAHYSELQEKYPGMYVAVKDGRVVAYGKEFGKVYDEAMEKTGGEFMIDYILSGEPFVLKAELQDNRS
ncbi:MAG: DUF5678 domain-containing protein [Candidatus Nezhaarchaeales archaeon]